MLEHNNSLRGKRGRMLLRVSTNINEASVPDQEKEIKKFMKTHGIIPAGGDEIIEGVSGSKIFNRHDLKRLLVSARHKKDYDVLLVYDNSRLTRGGALHGMSIRDAFAKAGVLVQSVMDPVPEGDFKEVMQTLIDAQNNMFSKKLSAVISRGIISAVLRGEVPTVGSIPIGIDRLYLRADNTPFLRLRYCGNRVRKLYNEENGKLISEFGRADGTAYRKQKGEKVRLVEGDPMVGNAIRKAFELRYKHNWGYARIGLYLTKCGVMPLKNTLWNGCSVRGFLLNPMYLGWSYFLKTISGLFHKITVDGPVRRHDVDQHLLEEEERETIPHIYRQRIEMLRMEQTGLNDFLTDPEVREKAELAISRFFDECHLPKKRRLPSGMNNRYPTTRYFLRGLIMETNYEKYLAGRQTGGTCVTRYYHLSHNTTFCETGSIGRRTVPAAPLEQAVLDIVRHLFQPDGRVETIVRQHVAKVLAERTDEVDRDRLTDELSEIKSRQRAIYATASSAQIIDLKDVLQGLRAREDEIRRQLSLMPVQSVADDPSAICNKVMAALVRLEESDMDEASYEKLRLMLRTFIRNFTLDLSTREARFEVQLPEELLRAGDTFEVMCAAGGQVHSSTGGAHNPRNLKIGVFKLIPPFASDHKCPTGAQYRWIEVTEDPSDGPIPEAA